MATWRLLPPVSPVANRNMTFNGRNYAAALGSYVDAPDFDGRVLLANGWTLLGLVGTTAQRPTVLPAGTVCYIDTTVGGPVFFDGATWRNYLGVSA